MDRNQAKEFYPFLQAYAEGRVIECRIKPSALEDIDVPNDWKEMKKIEYRNNAEYRIRSGPVYRPFNNTKECWQEMQKHQPFGWVKTDSGYEPIWHVNECDDFNATFKYSTFADGTPFGVKVEE